MFKNFIRKTPRLHNLLNTWANAPELKPKSIAFRIRSARIICEHTHNLPITEVDWKELNNWIQTLNYSATTVNGLITALKGATKIAMDDDWFEKDPTRVLKRKSQTYTEKELPEDDVMKQIADFLVTKNCEGYRLMEFLMYSGCRISEALNVKWSDINDDFIQITNAKTRGDRVVTRKVPILPEMASLLHRMKKKDSDYLFTITHARKPAAAIKRIWNIKWSHHYARHYFCSKCIESGVDLVVAAKWLGHVDTKMITRLYFHIRDKHSLSEAKKLKFT